MCQPSGDSCPGTERPLSDLWSVPARLPNAFTLMPNILIERMLNVLDAEAGGSDWTRSLRDNIEAYLGRASDPIHESRAAEIHAYEFLASYYESKGGMQVTADLIRLGEVEGTMTTREALDVISRALYRVHPMSDATF